MNKLLFIPKLIFTLLCYLCLLIAAFGALGLLPVFWLWSKSKDDWILF